MQPFNKRQGRGTDKPIVAKNYRNFLSRSHPRLNLEHDFRPSCWRQVFSWNW